MAHTIPLEHSQILGRLLAITAHVAREQGIADDGYRIIINTGAHARQEVPHLHIHLLGGEDLGAMAGA